MAHALDETRPPICVLLLPRQVEDFILRDQAEDLMRARSVIAVGPPRIPYGAMGRLPGFLARRLAWLQSHNLTRGLRLHRGEPRVIVIFHPLQYPLAKAMRRRCPDAELWYGRWDRYEHAYDASPEMRHTLEHLHEHAAQDSALTFVCSERLAELEREEGREAALVPLAADRFPAPNPEGTVVAVSLGHLGWRTDWALLREVADTLRDRLVLLLIGERHDSECADDEDFRRCCEHPSLVWLGGQPDAVAARLILTADVGIVPFKVEPFNDAGLPYRILKYARLGRRTVSPALGGVRTWERAVTVADDAQTFAAALVEQAGRRVRPDLELREWALAQTAVHQNAPLWDGLERLGLALPGER
ncbi:unannotated protein [freshwater metagenome]|uniref:Unannotated protein n=1 Tax=freshwater metagenome TaxID=449393 RepID=A0A6J7HCE0_9ZZZZ|nr:hypothetical protein [Actinomycetota bacterium]